MADTKNCFTQLVQFELHSHVCINTSGGVVGGLHISDRVLAMERDPLLEFLAGFEVVVVRVLCKLRVQDRLFQCQSGYWPYTGMVRTTKDQL